MRSAYGGGVSRLIRLIDVCDRLNAARLASEYTFSMATDGESTLQESSHDLPETSECIFACGYGIRLIVCANKHYVSSTPPLLVTNV